jgi:hypothetical protein
MLPSVLSVVAEATLLAHPPAPVAPPRVVTVRAVDFAFEAPERIKAMEDWSNAAVMPSWAIDVGGPNEASRGTPAEAIATLEPATYMMICYVPSPDGKLHVMKGMVRPLVVTAAGATRPAEPKSDNAGGVGPGPVTALGGAAGIAKGRRLFLDADFPPGEYLFLCFIPDAKDGKPHSEHGMVRQLSVK